ncbi:N-succinyl-L,L-diaminopimelate desuccinylase, partial [hydrothermal vent metagenome]
MAVTAPDAIGLLGELIRRPSVTPDAGGVLDLVQGWLAAYGFACHRLVFEAPKTPPVDNLFARLGTGTPHFCFAGHLDVVPPGDTS